VQNNLSKGLDINTLDFYGNNAIYYGCLCKHPKLVQFLLNNGAIDFEERGHLCTSNAVRQIMENFEKTNQKNLYVAPKLQLPSKLPPGNQPITESNVYQKIMHQASELGLNLQQIQTILNKNPQFKDISEILEILETIDNPPPYEPAHVATTTTNTVTTVPVTQPHTTVHTELNVEASAPMAEENLCKICFENPIDCVILRCGHMAICISCGTSLHACPICRNEITEVIKVFRS